jgi:hypothetical protein
MRQWLPPCVSLSKIGDGPNAPGDQLRYVFRPERARLERICIAKRCWIAHALARKNGQSRSRGHIERLMSLEGLLTAGS